MLWERTVTVTMREKIKKKAIITFMFDGDKDDTESYIKDDFLQELQCSSHYIYSDTYCVELEDVPNEKEMIDAARYIKSECERIKNCNICPFGDNLTGECNFGYMPKMWDSRITYMGKLEHDVNNKDGENNGIQ